MFTTAILLSWMFWWPLWQGGGLIGGDLYPYYFPQKTFLAESLKSGSIPLWNPFVGFGYPVLGESQTAALYPPNLLAYGLFDVNTAYNICQLAHYMFAFWGMSLLSRRLGLKTAGSLLAATVFVYGWFPARICLEWAVIGGAWFVWILWACVAFWQTGRRRYLSATALFLGLDLLAGHYNLAFITLLTLVPLTAFVVPPFGQELEQSSARRRLWGNLTARRGCSLLLALLLGFLLAGVQLLPTWELKSLSQRQSVNDAFAPTYGHLPMTAISQLWMPWSWYAGELTMDEQLGQAKFLAVPMATNQAEAQLYVGLLPLVLACAGWIIPSVRRSLCLHRPWGWLALTIVALLFATGWPTYWLSAVPGFGFFRGPGRYSMTAAWTLALMAGATLDVLLKFRNWSPFRTAFVSGLLLVVTTLDLWTASRQYQFGMSPYFGRQVFYATLLDQAPISFLSESPLRKFFERAGPRCRLYAPGQNIPSLLGVSCLPVYLGLGPEIYESDEIRVDFKLQDASAIQAARQRLLHFGVTHLLLEQPLDTQAWNVQFLGNWLDPFLNRALGRTEPFYLYALPDSQGRAFVRGAAISDAIQSMQVRPDRVRLDVACDTDCEVVLRDLAYPGWNANIGTSERYDEHFRSVRLFARAHAKDGIQTVEWVYRPRSVIWGGMLSLLGGFGLIAFYWRRERLPSASSHTAPATNNQGRRETNLDGSRPVR